jgi:hypothetical protein
MPARPYRGQKVPLKRVLRSLDGFGCGICRRSYPTMDIAYRCLSNCARNFLDSELIDVVRYGGRLRYRCQICRRNFPNRDSVEACVDECRTHWLGAAENSAPEGFSLRPRERTKYVAQGKLSDVKLLPPYRIKNMMADDDAELDAALLARAALEAAESAAAASEALGAGADNEADASSKEAPKHIRRKSDLKEKFLRKDAQYMCTFCLQRHYTKIDVIACFDGHPDEEVVED